MVEDWKKRHPERKLTQIEKQMQKRARAEYEKKIEEENACRAKKGLAPRITEQGGGGPGGGPGAPGMGSWSQAEVLEHIKLLEKQFYKE